jgi:heme/copper-type cytochrome/quinol oxidase subunit 3
VDRLPYADVTIATVLVAVGTALVASPWLGAAATLSLAVASGVAVLAMLDLISRSGRRDRRAHVVTKALGVAGSYFSRRSV